MIKGNSPAIQRVLETVRKVAATESTVLLQGASGTGKELVSQAIHENSSRRTGPLVRVHCASLSPSLLESELFGHVKGAFTGAHRDRVGRFEMADGGTLFLDEIGDISLETQIKLLRVLQTRSFEPVGGTRTVEVDVRLITATHQDLQKLISEGRFREDLFYRLNVVNITLPTLSERRDDVFELALHFLRRAAAKAGKAVTQIDEEVHEALARYSWPGNIRELENVIERSVVMCDGECITVNDLPQDVLEAASAPTRKDRVVGRSAESPVAAASIPVDARTRPQWQRVAEQPDGQPGRPLDAAASVARPVGSIPAPVSISSADGLRRPSSASPQVPAAPVGRTINLPARSTSHQDGCALDAPGADVVRSVRAAINHPAPSRPPTQPQPAALPDTHEELSEYELLERTLHECGGNKSQAARKLGIPRSTLFSRLRKAGLT